MSTLLSGAIELPHGPRLSVTPFLQTDAPRGRTKRVDETDRTDSITCFRGPTQLLLVVGIGSGLRTPFSLAFLRFGASNANMRNQTWQDIADHGKQRLLFLQRSFDHPSSVADVHVYIRTDWTHRTLLSGFSCQMQTHNGLLLFIALNEWLFRDTANVDLFHALVLPSQALRSFVFPQMPYKSSKSAVAQRGACLLQWRLSF